MSAIPEEFFYPGKEFASDSVALEFMEENFVIYLVKRLRVVKVDRVCIFSLKEVFKDYVDVAE